jgi:hypothetical protein
MKIALVLTVVFSVVVPATSRAQTPDPSGAPGVDLSVRTGFALPFGKTDADATQSISDEINGGIPLALEAAARINPMFSAGLMFQWVPLLVKNTTQNNCGNGVDCSGSVYHLGAEALLHFPQPGLVPWVGAGAGYEWLSLTASSGGTSASAGASGFEFLFLQAGIDGRLTPQFSLGGFVMFSISQYGSESITQAGTTVSGDVTDTSIHEWLTMGIRGTVGL